MSVMPYHVRIALSQYGDQFRAEIFTEDLGDTEGELTAANWQVLESKWPELYAGGGFRLEAYSAHKIGAELYDNMFGNKENAVKWQQVLKRAERDQTPIRLLIDATTKEVQNLPYGLLKDGNKPYLFRTAKERPDIRFVRIIRRVTPRRLNLDHRPIRLLLAAAEPTAVPSLTFNASEQLCKLAQSLDEKCTLFVCTQGDFVALRDKLTGPVKEWQREQFDEYVRTTPTSLQTALAEGDFDVLHLIAHGQHGDLVVLCKPDSGATLVESEVVTADELGGWCREKLQMAFLQVCRASQPGQGGFGGVAQQLLDPDVGNLAAVIASSYPLEAAQATTAAIAFYKNLFKEPAPDLDEAIERNSTETEWLWAFLEVWVRPAALGGTGTRGTFQFVSPYRGLARFEERDWEIFFGRETETTELVNILRDEPLVAILGDSGTGKSSLLRAGLAHRVRTKGVGLADKRQWQILTLTPGEHPAANLLALLTPPDKPISAAPASSLTAESLRAALDAACAPDKPLLVLFDQFEEMLTVCADKAERGMVGTTLWQLADEMRWRAKRGEQIYFNVVLALRTEYARPIAELPGLSDLTVRPYILKLPTQDKLREIVQGPAQASGYRFEDALPDGNPEHTDGLLDRLLRDPLLRAPESAPGDSKVLALDAGAVPLPLLEFALDRLWLLAVGRADVVFRHQDYETLNGLGGAIAHHADEVYNDLSNHSELGATPQRLMEEIMKGVVSAHGTNRPRRRSDLEAEPEDREHAPRMIEYLVGERLLIVRASPTRADDARIELAHEILVVKWALLKDWLTQDYEARAFRQEFQEDAESWERGTAAVPEKRADENLPDVAKAKHYRDQRVPLNIPLEQLTAGHTDFYNKLMEQIQKDEQTKQELRNQYEEAERQRKEAERQREIALGRQLAAQSESVRNLGDSLFTTSVLLGIEALRRYPSVESDRALRRALARLPKRVARLPFDYAHQPFALSENGKYFATAGRRDSTLRVFEIEGLKQVLSVPLQKHIQCISFSADGKYIAIGSGTRASGDASVLKNPSGEPICSLAHESAVVDVVFSPQAKYLATVSTPARTPVQRTGVEDARPRTKFRGRAHLWKVGSWQQVPRLPDWEIPTEGRLWFSPDEKYLACVDAASQSHVLRLDTMRQVARLSAQYPAHYFRFSPNGRFLVHVAQTIIEIWDTKKWRPVIELGPMPPPFISDVSISPDSQYLASTSGTGAFVWRTEDWSEVGGLPHSEGVKALQFSPNSRFLATLSYNINAHVWEVDSGLDLTQMSDAHGINGAAFSPEGNYLAVAGPTSATIWETKGYESEMVLESGNRVRSIAFSPDGRYLAIAGQADGVGGEGVPIFSVRVWEVANWKEVEGMRITEPALHVDFAPVSLLLAITSVDGTVRIIAVPSGELVHSFHYQMEEGSTVIAFDPTGHYLAITDGGTKIHILQMNDWREVGPPLIQERQVISLCFSPDGQNLFIQDSGGTSSQWEIASGTVTPGFWDAYTHEKDNNGRAYKNFVPSWRLTISKRGILATAGIDKTVRLWDIQNRSERLRLNHIAEVKSLEFDLEGEYVVTYVNQYGIAGTVSVWDTFGKELVQMPAPPNTLNPALALSPGARYLAIGGDGYVTVFLVQPQDLIAEACKRVTRNLTPDEWRQYLGDEPYRATCTQLDQ